MLNEYPTFPTVILKFHICITDVGLVTLTFLSFSAISPYPSFCVSVLKLDCIRHASGIWHVARVFYDHEDYTHPKCLKPSPQTPPANIQIHVQISFAHKNRLRNLCLSYNKR